MGSQMLKAALDYVAQGFKVFPIKIDKKPLTEHGLKDATQLQIRVRDFWNKWPDAGIGLVTDGLVVPDFDAKNGGLDSKVVIEAKYGPLPRTRTHRTGGGGLHYLYRNPNGADIRSTTKLGAYSGVDLRANGGYIVAPPSLHESGARYEVIDNAEIAAAPAWLMKLATKRAPLQISTTAEGIGQPIPEGQRNATLASLAGTMRRRGLSEEAILAALSIENKQRCSPPLPEAEIEVIAKSISRYEPRPPADTQKTLPSYQQANLTEVIACARRWLYLPDTGALEVILGAIAANRLPGDPVWILLVTPPGWGKTELLNSLTKLPEVHQVAVLTEASLLSGTPRRESTGAKGGLLREMGGFGIMLVKDFGGILSLSRETRGPILAALREIYDGAWTRQVGSDGGRTLSWVGKCGLVGGATPTIDGHYAVMALLGERFSYYRISETEESRKATVALSHAGEESEMRLELSTLVAGLFTHMAMPTTLPALSTPESDKLVALAIFTTRCRSVVERDSYSTREIQLIPGVESPTRLVKVLAELLRGLVVVGTGRKRAWELVEKVALDSMPALRQRILMKMMESREAHYLTSDLATALGYPSNTTRRALEDLSCYGVTERQSQGEGKADLWWLTDWTKKTYEAAKTTLPEILKEEYPPYIQILNTVSSISGKPLNDTTRELPDCLACGRNEWSYSPGGELLCPCGNKGGDQ